MTRRVLMAVGLVLMARAEAALAGMPAALPSDLPTRLRLHDSFAARLSAISFFLIGILLSAFIVQSLWNYLRRDFQFLPPLTMLKSLALVTLWGLLFVIVLTMISGARELMTPGAWKKQGFTYELNTAPPAMEPPESKRSSE
jgi:hypothetical protein